MHPAESQESILYQQTSGTARRSFPRRELHDLSSNMPRRSPSFESPTSMEPSKPGSEAVGRDNDVPGSSRGGFSAGIKDTFKRSPKKQKRIARLTWKDRARDRLRFFWQHIIIEIILRQAPLPPTKDGRHVPLNPTDVGNKGLVDERSDKPYISNFIRSSRYTLWNFIPLQLIFQFSKLGNFYFLVIGVIQMIPGLSTVGRWTTIAPLAGFVAFSMAKEGYDDWRRYQMDKQENRSAAWVLDRGVRANPSNRPKKVVGGGRWKKVIDAKEQRDRGYEAFLRYGNNGWMAVQWQDVQVGDLIRLRRDDAVPADLAILHATGPNGIAYIDTMALDGETNLKSKQACPLFAERCSTEEGLLATRAMVVSEDPNLDLYSYDGRVSLDDETLPLTMNNVVYRGSTIRNTSMVIGLVINTGEECKIRMNANKNVHAKKPAMQSIVNKIVLIQMVGVVCITAGLTAGYFIWEGPTENNSFYLVQPNSIPSYDASVPATEIFFGYLIMFNTLIPLSLYISLEIIKIGQFFMMLDAELYDPVSDTPMVANTTTILENLGQVTHIFSDKTGTLTENIMRFRKMSVAGIAALHDMDVEKDEDAKQERITARNNVIKGKSKVEPVQNGEDDWPLRSTPQRNSSTVSRSRWRSSVHPNEMPEMNTEELLAYVRRKPNSVVSRKVKHFFLCIALCHTCLPEMNESGELVYQSSSPDELALIEAARDLGYLLIDRPSNSIKLQTTNANGVTEVETYQVLDVIEFSSKRKRMSIIVRMPDGRISVICKGADNVIMARLRQRQLADEKVRDVGRRVSVRRTQEQEQALQRMSSYGDANYSPRESFQSGPRDSWRRSFSRRSNEYNRYSQHYERDQLQSPLESEDPMQTYDTTNFQIDEGTATSDTAVFEKIFQDINDFASDGLRTLLFGYRYIDEESYWKWKDIYRQAETSLVDRQERIEEASELIEQKFELAGATAIEDKLQDGVPESIDKLRRANIKVWMLTGDKRETAINIGHSARLCKPYSTIFVLDVKEGNLEQILAEKLKELAPGSVAHSVMVVDGETLAAIDDDEDLAPTFYDLAVLVDSVICCRASPSQKAHLVKSIRRFVPKSMTLAIGDGANDIGMIQASHVGIGISGREGLQAARISDYSIAQFRFLQKLLFVHGRWNYLRTGKYVLGTFWKEILFFLVQAHYQRFNGYSGTSLYEEWSLTVFNILFTSLPVILMGIFEKDLSADTLMAVPELYTFGQRKMGFNYLQYLGWVIMGVAGSFIIYYFMWLEYRSVLFDNDNDIYSLGVLCFTVAVIFINIKLLMLETHSKSIIIFAGFAVSIAGWFIWNIILSRMYAHEFAIYFVRDNFLHNFGGQLSWWVTIALALFTLITMELCVQAIRRVYWPTDQDLMQRIEKDAVASKIVRDRAAAAERGEAEELELQDVTAANNNNGNGNGNGSSGGGQHERKETAWTANQRPRHERQQHYRDAAADMVAEPQQTHQPQNNSSSWHQTRHDQRNNPFNDY